MIIDIPDRPSSLANTQLDAETDPVDGDGMEFKPDTASSFTSSDRNTDSCLVVMFCGLSMYIDIFAVYLQNSAKILGEYI
jgi:hypothetical protein